MSRLSLKNDFKDGEILYGAQINTNNDATVAAVNDNYEEILKLKDIKADVVNVDNQLKTKVDVGTFNAAINSLNDTKADKSVVNQKADKTELANKADLIYVNNEFSKKADISYVNTQLTQKANLSDVNTKLSLKADKATTYTKDEVNTTIDNKIVSKADKTELNSKADKSSLGDLSQLLTSDKSSAVAAINETIREGVANNIDALSITKSNDNKIQTVGVIDSNAKGYATKTWTGTRNEYNSIQNKNANTLYYIIDDDDEHELVANKVKTIDENSNDTQYPSAKAVYDRIKEAAPDLSNYVQYDNYAVSNKGGVIKGNLNGFNVNSSGTPLANVYNKENYDSVNESIFISKGTLENIKDDYVGTSEPINVFNDNLDNVIPKQTATDSIINVNDALKYKTFNFKVDGAYKQTTYTGKNLANFSSLYCPILTGSLENQEATINGTTEQNTNVTLKFKKENVNLKANQPYTISVICSGTVTGGTYKKLYLSFNENDSIEIGDYSSNHTTTYTFTPDTDMQVTSINMDISLGQTFNNLKVKVQIEEGSTATDYEPYVGGVAVPNPNQPSEITTLNFDKITKIGQNLYNVNDVIVNNNYQIDENGWISNAFDNSDGASIEYFNYYTKNLKLKPNTNYNIFLEIKAISGLGELHVTSKQTLDNIQIAGQFDNDYILAFENLKIGTYNKIQMTINSDLLKNVNYGIRTFLQFNPGESGSITFRISVIEDTSVTPENFVYQPYQETNYLIDLQGNEMVSLPNGVKDELQIDKEGNVNLIKNVGKKILNGSEEWMMNTNYTTSSMLAVQYLENNMLSNSIIISDRFTYNAVTDIDTIRAAVQYVLIGLDITEFTTVDDFKNWLQSNNTTIYYQLAEPQTISLGKLSDIITTEQGSNTFAINSNIDTQISATYALNIKKYIDNKIATVSQAVIEQE